MKVRSRFPNGGIYPDGFFRIDTKDGMGMVTSSIDLTTLIGEVAHTFGQPNDLQALVVYDQIIQCADGIMTYALTIPWWALQPEKAQ